VCSSDLEGLLGVGIAAIVAYQKWRATKGSGSTKLPLSIGHDWIAGSPVLEGLLAASIFGLLVYVFARRCRVR